jgi:hypothetical protein
LGNSLLTASSLNEITELFLSDVKTGVVKKSTLENFAMNAQSACDLLMRNLSSAANLIASFKQIAVDQTSNKRRRFKLGQYSTGANKSDYKHDHPRV